MKEEKKAPSNHIDGVSAKENRLINHFFHDFKGEISTVIMCIEAVYEGVWGQLNENQKSWLKRAEKNCHHMLYLINNFRDTTQLEEGSFPEEPEEVDIRKAIDDLLEFITPFAKERGQEVTFEVGSNLPRVIFRASIFFRILQNLYWLIIDNTRQNGRIITEISHDNSKMKINISFEGVEISEDLLNTVFDKFAQTEVGLQLGRGFTMLFCKEAIKFLGGDLKLSTWPGYGNKVELTIPIEKSKRISKKRINQ